MLFACGFSCTSRSRLSKNSTAKRGCVQRSEGATGETFHKAREYIFNARPWINILENVSELSATDDNLLVSDEEWMLQ
eukprot:5356709-Prorocentrum_lima.AAC.1